MPSIFAIVFITLMLGLLFYFRAQPGGFLSISEEEDETHDSGIQVLNLVFLGLIAVSSAIFLSALISESYLLAGPFGVLTALLIVLRVVLLERLLSRE